MDAEPEGRRTTWNYRLVVEHLDNGEDHLTVRAVYYSAGNINMWSTEAQAASGESVDEMRDDLARMLRACDMPVLEVSTDGPSTRLVEVSP